MFRLFIALAATVAASSALAADPPSCVPAPALADKAWAKCAACHSMTKDETGKLGPNLHGLIGRRAGSLEGFVFSPALKDAKFEWSPEVLDAFLAAPMKVVPNNRMPFAGLPNVKERQALICKLSQSAK